MSAVFTTPATNHPARTAAGLVALFLALLARPPLVVGQAPPVSGAPKPAAAAPAPASTKLTVEQIQQLAKSLDEKALDPNIKTAAAGLYEQAIAQVQLSAQWAAEATKWAQLRAAAPSLTATLKEQLAGPSLEAPFAPPPDATIVQMEQALATAADKAAQATKELLELERQPALRAERRKVIPTLLLDAKKRLADLERELAAGPSAGDAPDIQVARQTLLTAERQAVQNAITAQTEELSAYDATVELLDLQQKAAARDATQAEQDRKLVEQTVAVMRQRESAKQSAKAKAAAASVPEVVRPLADENLRLSTLRTGPDGQPQLGLTAKIAAANLSAEAADKTLQQLESIETEVEEREKLGGLDDFHGPWVLEQFDKLPRISDLRRQIYEHQRTISETQRELSGLKQRQSDLDDLDAALASWISRLDPAPEAARRERIAAVARGLLEQQEQLLDAVMTDGNTLLVRLNAQIAKLQVLVARVTDLRDRLRPELLWVRAQPVLGPRDLRNNLQAGMWLINRENGAQVATDLPYALREHALFALITLVLVVGLLAGRNTMKRQQWRLGATAAQGYLAPFRVTVRALGWTILLTLLWPVCLLLVGWPLYDYYGGAESSHAVGAGLLFCAIVFLAVEFMRRTCAVHGLAADHFRWDSRRLAVLRRNLRWLAVCGLPLVFLTAALVWEGAAARRDSLGRLLLMIACGILSFFMWRVVRPLPPTTADAAPRKPGFWQRLAQWFLIVSPLFILMLLVLGYQYTAQILIVRLLLTLCLLEFMLVFHGIALRWLCSVRGKLAIEQSRQRREAKQSQLERGTLSGDEVTADVDQGIDLGTVNLHTRRLLQASLGILAFVGLWLLWLDVLPGGDVLARPIWSTPVTVTKTGPETDGTPTLQTVTEFRAFTVANLVLAVVLGLATLVAARNFPGLLEVSLPQNVPLDAGARYALSTIIRYAIFAVGTIIVFNQMGIGWSNIQWLVAALSVGVGFGLQELVANFISGLILLFERPVRVNDIVTIGDVTGVVTRVQIRATTIRNWDQQEYIVPNKELITGHVLNWTLSDTNTRLVLNVGIAYGSDTARAAELIHEILRHHPCVLTEPAPMVTFEGFGDSSLNFVIRAYLSSLDRRIPTTHELHSQIHDRFREAGIEIPFPQRDLHIRSSAVPLRA